MVYSQETSIPCKIFSQPASTLTAIAVVVLITFAWRLGKSWGQKFAFFGNKSVFSNPLQDSPRNPFLFFVVHIPSEEITLFRTISILFATRMTAFSEQSSWRIWNKISTAISNVSLSLTEKTTM